MLKQERTEIGNKYLTKYFYYMVPCPAAPTRNCAVLWPLWALWCASGPKSCVFSLFPTMKKAAVVCSVTVGFFLSSPYRPLLVLRGAAVRLRDAILDEQDVPPVLQL